MTTCYTNRISAILTDFWTSVWIIWLKQHHALYFQNWALGMVSRAESTELLSTSKGAGQGQSDLSGNNREGLGFAKQ